MNTGTATNYTPIYECVRVGGGIGRRATYAFGLCIVFRLPTLRVLLLLYLPKLLLFVRAERAFAIRIQCPCPQFTAIERSSLSIRFICTSSHCATASRRNATIKRSILLQFGRDVVSHSPIWRLSSVRTMSHNDIYTTDCWVILLSNWCGAPGIVESKNKIPKFSAINWKPFQSGGLHF